MNITSPREITRLLAENGLSPLKKFGQNFLCDENVVQKIADCMHLANFLLVKLLQKETTAFDVFTHCVKNGLMIRDCSSFKSLDGEFIRFCVMDSKDNQRLLDELSFLCRQK